ncbi:hypothetical protein OGAPHI_002698 [Ogataea philodendri]|uniref:Uncharacterized protein n=1 Tax=Ogataea philodendri TaxID=1378263 RepID=A0A9P8T7A3_9ASCO|nr:uncharacterized protein OGAPHI_002698 [Ogataea philodendri]KAH3668943.1 hypothetical protein OGAPHI_002698 [Ogataea philodendri]
MIFSMLSLSNKDEVTLFSTPSITPSLVQIPMAVDPNLMASREYSTWKSRPSGEKVDTPLSYSLLVKNMLQQYLDGKIMFNLKKTHLAPHIRIKKVLAKE